MAMRAVDLTAWLGGSVMFTNAGRPNWERGWREFDCPFHADAGAHFGWHVGRGFGHCWTCGWRGGALRLVMGMTGCGPREAAAILRTQPNLDGAVGRFPITSWETRDELGVGGGAWPDGALAFGPAPRGGLIESRCWEYLHGRVGKEAIAEYGWRWVARGDLRGFVVCPVHERGEMVYWVARATTREAVYRYPSFAESGGVGKGEVLFGLDRLARGGRAVIVEGVFDAIAVTRSAFVPWGPGVVPKSVGVASLGLGLSAVQAAKLALAEPGAVDVYWDADAEAKRPGIGEATIVQLTGYGVPNVRVLRGAGDPDEGPGEPVGLGARLRERL